MSIFGLITKIKNNYALMLASTQKSTIGFIMYVVFFSIGFTLYCHTEQVTYTASLTEGLFTQYIHNLHKKKGNLCLVNYFFVATMAFDNKSYTLGKPLLFPN